MTRTRIAVVGSANIDLVVAVDRLPEAGETVLGADVVYRSGGKGANQAVAALRYGAETSLYAAIGRDTFGTQLANALADEGLDVYLRRDDDRPSGVALVVVDGAGANTITVSAGANDTLSSDGLADLGAALPETDALLLQLEIPLETALDAARRAVAHGVTVTLNASPLPSEITEALWELVALTDVLIVNETEARTLRAGGWDWAQRARSLLDRGPDVAVITLGAEGAVAAKRDQVVTQRGIPVDAVDTTGAGDTFCGVFAAEFSRGGDLRRAMAHACAAGAIATTRVGAREGMPSRTAVAAVLTSPGAPHAP
ncbi:ribokinase [Jiangella asiatica]|uniref:Ribokinase n=1 Tax=Jiangella asiatica TaxID=2530372 RepID=A0A4R5DV46_9ACTN|nr:ribokinase [Jiangella asiatica]TDE15105.1 ribokinase [Jiangella asiatica]